jgi:hypothetical protein
VSATTINYYRDGEPDKLEESFRLQTELQARTYGADPGDIEEPSERIQFAKDMILALTDELHEALGEIGWKPWATSRYFNEEEFKGEMVDAFHFFMNLCLVAGMDADELFERYQEKRTRNQKRQAEGYDGVEGKCPACKRAFDDLSKAWGMEVSQVSMESYYLRAGDNRLKKPTRLCLECAALI